MRNMSLRGKISILVGILVATILIVGLVGGGQLRRLNLRVRHLVNVTNRAVNVTSKARILLLSSVRSEKNAAMAPDDARSASFSDEAQRNARDLDSLLPEVHALISESLGTSESKDLDDFRRSWDAYKTNQDEVLRLARMNTNVAGRRLLTGPIVERIGEIRQSLHALQARIHGQGSPIQAGESADGSCKNSRFDAALNLVMAHLAEVITAQHIHLDSTSDTEMNRLDVEIADLWGQVRQSLEQLQLLVDDNDRSPVAEALLAVPGLVKRSTEVQELSRTNSNLYCVELTITKTVELVDACDAALQRLLGLLEEQAAKDRDAAHLGYLRALAITGGTALVGILGGIVLASMIARLITRPVAQGVELASALAQGDLTQRLALDQHDEIGQLTGAIDEAACNFAKIITEVHHVSSQIGTAAGDLGSVSNQLLSQSEEMSTQAGFVAGNTEQMSSNISMMAAAAEQMSMNIASISSASEEISVNVGTISSAAEETAMNVAAVVEAIQKTTKSFEAIASDARDGAQVTSRASQMARDATESMQTLDRSAGEIGKVTEMIKLIAMQTNLLALNATIEAASAGEAGKGFAVVANEIKELAQQSGKAAEEIARMIEGIQTNTRGAVTVIDKVAETIQTIHTAADRTFKAVEAETHSAAESAEKLRAAGQGVGHIAQSIMEVAKGTTDMSRNTSEAARASTDVSHNASEAARGIRETSSNIHGVSTATKLNTASAQEVHDAAARLQAISSQLNEIVRRFRIVKGMG